MCVKRDWITCSDFVNQSRLSIQHKFGRREGGEEGEEGEGDLYDYQLKISL